MVTRHTTVLLIVSLATMLAAVFSDAETTEPRLRALEAKAVCAAFAAYQSMGPKADLQHFAIFIDKEGRDFTARRRKAST
jgi:hypothetical protein